MNNPLANDWTSFSNIVREPYVKSVTYQPPGLEGILLSYEMGNLILKPSTVEYGT